MSKFYKGNSRFRPLLLLVCALMLVCTLSALGAEPAHLSVAMRRRLFDLVWTRVRDRHYDPKMNGLDWNAVRRRYEPKALQAQNDAAFYQTLNQMLSELGQSHLGVRAPEEARDMAGDKPAPASDRQGETGITALLLGEQPVITRVVANSAGAEAGIKPGQVLTAVDDKPLNPRVKHILERKPALREGEKRVAVWALMRGLLNGSVGQTVKVTVTNPGGDVPRTYTLKLRPATGNMIRFGALPPIPSEVETRTLAGGVGYIRFNIFLMPLLDSIRKAIQDFTAANAPGIILDLRDNPGGLGSMAPALAGLFVSSPTDLGTMRTRATELKFPVFPQQPYYSGPLVVLTDEAALSTSEILAAGLQEIKRAVVIGRATGGMVLPSQVEELPGGGEFQYVFADFHTPKGIRLEGRGVTPDIPVALTPQLLLSHPDPVLDAALAYLAKPHPPSTAQNHAVP